MGVRGLTKVAAHRDTTATTKGLLDVLAQAVPAEVIAVYTTVVAGTSGLYVSSSSTADASQSHHLLTARVLLVVAAAISIVLLVGFGWSSQTPKAQRKRKAPMLECATALAAFGAWAFAMPSGLSGLFVANADLGAVNLIAAAIGALLTGALGAGLRFPVK